MSDGALSVLARRLRSLGVPSLSALIARLGEGEEYHDFITLVREFLPEREVDILGKSTPAEQVATFSTYFEDRYFPLDIGFQCGDVECYGDLTRGIPVMPSGLSYEDYHEVISDWRGGYQLMTYLVGEEELFEDIRTSLAEACLEYVPQGLLARVPEDGFSPDEFRILYGTPYQGLAHWANVIWHNTGNFFLDTDCEMLWQGGLPEWNRENVEGLTQEWQQAEVIHEEISNLVIGLESDPPARFEELLNFILERR